MCDLIIKMITERGIEIKHKTIFHTVLSDMISDFGITNVKDAISTSNRLVHFANFSGFCPAIDENSLKSMITSWNNKAERSETK